MSSVPETLLRNWSLADSVERYKWTRRSASFVEVKDQTVQKLQDQLRQVGQELRLKGKEQKQLESLRDQLENDIDDLTANLFENANKMVVDANVKRMDAEKELEQAQSTVSKLQADILALKTLISSNENEEATEIPPKAQRSPSVKKKFSFKRITSFPRARSQHQLSMESPTSDSECNGSPCAATPTKQPELVEDVDGLEEFQTWRASPQLNDESPFIRHLVDNDVQPCLNFGNSELEEMLVRDIITNSLSIEPVKGEQQLTYCKLIGGDVLCSHMVRLCGADDAMYISQNIRDKLITVCELFLYLSYVKQGLIRSSNDRELFEQIQLLRRNMVLQRLGFPLN